MIAFYPSLAACGRVWRSELALAEEAVPALGIVRTRLAAAAELRIWQHRSLKYADMRRNDFRALLAELQMAAIRGSYSPAAVKYHVSRSTWWL